MRRVFFISIVFMLTIKVSAQKNALIYFPEANEIKSVNKSKLPDTINVTADSCKFRIVVTSIKGKAQIRKFSNDNLLEYEGQYAESLGLLSKYITVEELNSTEKQPNKWIVLSTYYQPLPDGLWRYYDKAGKLIREVTFNKGIVIKSVTK